MREAFGFGVIVQDGEYLIDLDGQFGTLTDVTYTILGKVGWDVDKLARQLLQHLRGKSVQGNVEVDCLEFATAIVEVYETRADDEPGDNHSDYVPAGYTEEELMRDNPYITYNQRKEA